MDQSVVDLVVVFSMPRDYSGNLQGAGYSVRFIASQRVFKGARRGLYPSEQPRENSALLIWRLNTVQMQANMQHYAVELSFPFANPLSLHMYCITKFTGAVFWKALESLFQLLYGV